ncbi:endo-1,4-beta-xylanase [Brevundimonas aveniformis]|uniref:endo-1,4-beta-xylanase n=1 Tax=Brevundimonas aveniformis TaxID=370977 RepID=UPI00041EB9D7|nr:endo-1,4-beta-xylanase [Brevundimonas aveniformis]
MRLSRRALLASTLALAACDRPIGATAAAQTPPKGSAPALRDLAPYPFGTQLISTELDTPIIAELAARHFDQVNTGFELKMEYIVQPDGRLRFEGGDRLAAFCRANGQAIHAHTLVWYADTPDWFARLDGSRRAMEAAYDGYVREVAGRYAGRVRAWDVVNEPVTDEGSDLRDSLWSRNLGQDGHFIRAFELAHEADPNAILFTNDYNLESNPTKRRTFLNLVERMMNRGVPIGGIGTQCHVSVDLPAGALTTALRDIASLGLPVHVSEFDCSLVPDGIFRGSQREREADQIRLYEEALESYAALPARQQYGFTVWGVRDAESWLRRTDYGGDPSDRPLLFDDLGQPKPVFWAVAEALRG